MADPSVYGASWYAANAVDAPARGKLNLELDIDVCVIGAGLAGLAVALEVARRGWSVAVLEARRIAWNASGRNAGFVTPGFSAAAKPLADKVGLAHAQKLWALSESGVEYVRRTIRETDMPGIELEETGWLHVSRTGDQVAEQAEFLVRLGATAEFWPESRVRSVLRSERYFGGVFLPNAFSIHPLNYALGLAAAAEAVGVRIFEETPALEIDPAGVRKRITTPSARVRTGHVVFAGNVHIDTLRPDIAGTLSETWAHSIVTEPLGERLQDAVRFRGAVTDNAAGDSDYRIVGGDRLLWSSRTTVREGSPRRYGRRIQADIRRVYPQLGNVEAEYAWSGALGTPVHRMPQIGELSPGVWLLSGFGGQGIATTAMGGQIVAGAIVDGDQRWRLFEPFDLVWAGGGLGRAAVQVSDWYGRGRESVSGWLARRRSAGRRPDIADDAIAAVPDPSVDRPSDEQPKRRGRKRRKAKVPDEPGASTPAASA